jgi:hypothetical protein
MAKIPLPKKFNRESKKLKTFLTGIKLYFRHYATTFPTKEERILAAATNIKGDPNL